MLRRLPMPEKKEYAARRLEMIEKQLRRRGITDGAVLAAMMGVPPMQMRCDLAVTVWLVDASTYDGGELLIDTDGVGQPWKGAAGDCLIYPADTLHRVAPVTRGVREVAVFWIQTVVRDDVVPFGKIEKTFVRAGLEQPVQLSRQIRKICGIVDFHSGVAGSASAATRRAFSRQV